jgi:hypothetical protein
VEVARSHRGHALREGRHDGADDLRSGRLQRLPDDPDTHLVVERARGGDPEPVARQIDVVGRVQLPQPRDDVDGLGEDLVAVLVQDAEQLGVRGQRTGAHAEDEPAAGEVVEHRAVDGHQGRVHVREVRRARAQPDLAGLGDQRGEEDQAVGDVLVPVGQVLADERVVETEAVGQDDGLPVLAQGLGPRPPLRVHRHGEVAQSHDDLLWVGPVSVSVSGSVKGHGARRAVSAAVNLTGT